LSAEKRHWEEAHASNAEADVHAREVS
jgi:hypothetical protein